MSDTTFEEACRCWRCGQPGKEVARKKAAERHQGYVAVIECITKLCHNFAERWIVQIRPDGTIPDRSSDRPGLKVFTSLSDAQISAGEATVRNLER